MCSRGGQRLRRSATWARSPLVARAGPHWTAFRVQGVGFREGWGGGDGVVDCSCRIVFKMAVREGVVG